MLKKLILKWFEQDIKLLVVGVIKDVLREARIREAASAKAKVPSGSTSPDVSFNNWTNPPQPVTSSPDPVYPTARMRDTHLG